MVVFAVEKLAQTGLDAMALKKTLTNQEEEDSLQVWIQQVFVLMMLQIEANCPRSCGLREALCETSSSRE